MRCAESVAVAGHVGRPWKGAETGVLQYKAADIGSRCLVLSSSISREVVEAVML